MLITPWRQIFRLELAATLLSARRLLLVSLCGVAATAAAAPNTTSAAAASAAAVAPALSAAKPAAAGGTDPTADAAELQKTLEGVDKLWFGSSSTAEVAMTVKTSHYERVLRLTYWVQGQEQTLIRINAPQKEQGTATLRLGPDIYNYLPKIDRTVKVSAALRNGSWMGSHFSNDDLVRAAQFSRDFTAKLIAKKAQGTVTLWTVDLTPKPNVPIAWARVRMILDKERTMPLSQEFFDERGAIARTITFTDLQTLGGRLVPARVKVVPADLPSEYTEIHYEKIQRGIKYPADFFSLARLPE